jgi:Na+-driven multidrug efflux pump
MRAVGITGLWWGLTLGLVALAVVLGWMRARIDWGAEVDRARRQNAADDGSGSETPAV